MSANIAEGYKRFGKNEKVRFLNIAEASLTEVANYIELGRSLNYLESKEVEELLGSVGRLLTAYKNAIIRDIRSNQ